MSEMRFTAVVKNETVYLSVLTAIGWASAVIGLGLSAMVALCHLYHRELPFLGGFGQCAALSMDPGSYFLGVPISVYAFSFFAILVVLSAISLLGRNSSPLLPQAILALGVLGIAAGCAGYVYLRFDLHVTCLVCDLCSALVALYTLCNAILTNMRPHRFGQSFRITTFLVGATAGACSLVMLPTVLAHTPLSVPIDPNALDKIPKNLLISDRAHTLGFGSASETFVVFADGECPFCARVFPILFNAAMQSRDVKLVLRDYPLPSHQYAFDDAIGAELAAERGQLWQFESSIYKPKREYGAESILLSEGWTEKQVSDRLTPHDLSWKRVLQDQALGDSIGISAVPLILDIVNGQVHVVSEAYVTRRFGR